MAGMWDYADTEIDGAGKSLSRRYALQDRCYFKMALQIWLRCARGRRSAWARYSSTARTHGLNA